MESDIWNFSNFYLLLFTNKSVLPFIQNAIFCKKLLEYAHDKKIYNVLECGSGKVLSGLFKRFSKDFSVYNIETIEDLKKFEI